MEHAVFVVCYSSIPGSCRHAFHFPGLKSAAFTSSFIFFFFFKLLVFLKAFYATVVKKYLQMLIF